MTKYRLFRQQPVFFFFYDTVGFRNFWECRPAPLC